jgi:shikimate dehydrogenase
MRDDIYELCDLDSRELLDRGHKKPARFAVIGFPVAHSASPAMHQPALDACGIDARYIKLEIQPGVLTEALMKLKLLGFQGANITVPHKFSALDACHHVDAVAQQMRAVNTVKFIDDEIHGWNTDGPGFAKAITEEFQIDLLGKRIIIIGAGGGAGQAIATQCAIAKAERVILVNRSVDKIKVLADLLKRNFPTTTFHALSLNSEELIGVAYQSHIIVNTSSLGLSVHDPSPIVPECFAPHHCVYDTIYNPSTTKFLRDAKLRGAKIGNGFSMLLHQGVLAFNVWHPDQFPIEIMRNGLRSVS